MGARGERVIIAGDKEITILFTNQALANAEQRMNKAVLGVARELMEGQGSIADVANLLRAGMEAAGRANGRRTPVPLNEAYQVMDQVGFAPAMTAVMEAMTAVLTYSGDATENGPDPNP